MQAGHPIERWKRAQNTAAEGAGRTKPRWRDRAQAWFMASWLRAQNGSGWGLSLKPGIGRESRAPYRRLEAMSKRAAEGAGAKTTMTRSGAGLVHGFLASGSKWLGLGIEPETLKPGIGRTSRTSDRALEASAKHGGGGGRAHKTTMAPPNAGLVHGFLASGSKNPSSTVSGGISHGNS